MNYITQAGHDTISKQIKILHSVDIANAIKDIERARENGRLDENEEFHQAMSLKEQIENRISELKNSLSKCKIFSGVISTDTVGFGSCVTIKDANDKERSLTLVGSLETDALAGRISTASPIGSELLGHIVGDIVDVEIPTGFVTYEIISITAGKI